MKKSGLLVVGLFLAINTQAQTLVKCQTQGNWYVDVLKDTATGQVSIENYKLVEESPRPDQIFFRKVYTLSENVQVSSGPDRSTVLTGKSMKLVLSPANSDHSRQAWLQKALSNGQLANARFQCM